MSTFHVLSARSRTTRGVAAALVAATTLALSQVPAVADTRKTAATAAHATPTAQSVAAPPIGELAPSGCTTTGTDTQCDLYAMTGTTQLLGTELPIWGFSSTGDAGSATAPGPVLAVHEGDTVTVTVHNGLDENVSLSLPGQPASAFTHGLAAADQTGGAAPGGTSSYTFRADRAGTFLYEAGHTPDGARQVAMGLAGALVVLPADGTANGHAYDDDAVVVLSEIDPALNAHPATFDMRTFEPRWRLVNGKAFPETAPIGTDQGRTVLLRYVNVGARTHPMSLLGTDQLELARDGHPLAHPQRQVVAEVEPGSTHDTLVTMPSGPETRVTLFEEGAHLDNAGQTEADPSKVATGGMMTFLDTNAPAPTDDLVGPAATHATSTPAVSDGLAPVQVEADLSDVKSGGANLSAAELLVDDSSTAAGFGIPMTGTFGSPTAHVTGSIPDSPGAGGCTPDSGPPPVALECLDAGKHVIYVRGQDSVGNWGVVTSVVLNLAKTGPATTGGATNPSPANGARAIAISATGDDTSADGTITKAEYFVDSVGDPGTGRAMTLNKVAAVVSETATLPLNAPSCADPTVAAKCLTEGPHHVFVRSHDSLGLWGPVLDIPLTVDRTGPGVDGADVSPTPSNGLISAPGSSGYLRVSALVTDRDNGGALQDNVVAAEGFFAPTSATPAPGTGFGMLATDGKYDSTSENVYGRIPLSQVRAKADGSYDVLVRAKDKAGNWGPLFGMKLVIDKTAPNLATLVASPNPTAGAPLLTLSAAVANDTSFQAAEWWTGDTDPGVGKATRSTVGFADGMAVVVLPLAGMPLGTRTFNMRVRDMAGNWSNAVSTSVHITSDGRLFADSFDGGDLSRWTSQTNAATGTMAVMAAAGLPPGGTNLGLAVSGTGTHYVRDGSPQAESAYHARFLFAANTFTSGTAAAVTIMEARPSTGRAFAVQYRKRAATGTQLRIVLDRSGGTTTGTWRTLPAGAHTLAVDWSAGPATGADPGTLVLSVDGTPVDTLHGDTSALRVESFWLGLVRGLNDTSTGTAYFDSFTSARIPLP